MHLKRSSMPKTWPLPRKGTKYVVKPYYSLNKIPLLLVLRDILKVAKTTQEVKKILNQSKIKVNGKIVKDTRYPLTLFDIISLDNKSFKIILENKKINAAESKEESKIAKIIGKKMRKKNKIQVNLSDGRNYLFDKGKVGDSVVIDMKNNKISEILPLKINSKIMFMSGKHLGETGKIENIKGKTAVIEIENRNINFNVKDLMVIK